MNKDLKDRAVLPIAIPITALGAIAMATIAFSRVMLTVPSEVAVAVALMVSLNILIVSAVVARRSSFDGSQIFLLLGAAVLPLAIGGAVSLGIVNVGAEPHEPAGLQPLAVKVSAEKVAFDTSEIHLDAGRQSRVSFENLEPIPHNLSMYTDDKATEFLYTPGQFISGPATVIYDVPALDAGEYFFRCDVHPTIMIGTVVVEESAEPTPQ